MNEVYRFIKEDILTRLDRLFGRACKGIFKGLEDQ